MKTVSRALSDLHTAPTAASGTHLFDAPTPLRIWHLASLDAPTVAVVWLLAFAWAGGVLLPMWAPILLALVAWAIYIADRLLDARLALHTGQHRRLRSRHYFHWRHRRIFMFLCAVSASAAIGIVLALVPAAARRRNCLLAAAGLAYFIGIHFTGRHGRSRFAPPWNQVLPNIPKIPKELLVALLFTAACAVPTFGRAVLTAASAWSLALLTVFFVMLAWLNCHAIERWESVQSPTRNSDVFSPAILLTVIGMLFAASLAGGQRRLALLAAAGATSAILLALLDRLRNRLAPLTLRAAADLVLLAPLALLLR